MNRIMFVEDERQLLAGLLRELEQRRFDWDISFYAGGRLAIDACEARSPHALLLDLGALGVSGLDLLRDVRRAHPDAVRIVLAGRAAPELIAMALPLAHHCLVRPSDPEEIERLILRGLTLRGRLSDPVLSGFVSGGDALPAVPIHAELAEAISCTKRSPGDLTDIITQDGEIVDHLRELVNSPFLGLSTPVRDPYEAIQILGPSTLKALVLELELFRACRSVNGLASEIETLRRHGIEAAATSARLAAGTNDWNVARIAGLLHDLGRLLMVDIAPEPYAEVLRQAEAGTRPLGDLERERFGFTHADLGAYAAGWWGLPWSIVEPIAFHHDPLPLWWDHDFDARHAVYLAEHLLNEATGLECDWDGEPTVSLAIHGLEELVDELRVAEAADTDDAPARERRAG